MRILAIETTDKTGGAAVLDDCNILAEKTLDRNQRTAQALAPAIKTLLERVGWSPKDVQLVGVSVGSGSFTGLRIGVTTAKVFAYAVGAEILGINTLEAIALAGSCKTACQSVLHVAVDALRGDVVAQPFSIPSPGQVRSLGRQELLPVERWLERLKPADFVSGPALGTCLAALGATADLSSSGALRLPSGARALDRELWFPRASAVGRLAAMHYAAGRRDNLWTLTPHYCRRSAAEEKWEALGK
ncbi:MAG: tRNA (adenosine(37)-N6)-threonylcarbamoyltransferase complex dimerization subunit type 1 TsaB [Pirellulales bacterium]|nr:tRNA (adenosine(37)-N6)-threonylcarbamoyltransferase complex dimerization subunit type 1 TsaB [Pirellulales bacterium]